MRHLALLPAQRILYRISHAASGGASRIIHKQTARGSRFDRLSQQHMD
jgi:hypothetical protein